VLAVAVSTTQDIPSLVAAFSRCVLSLARIRVASEMRRCEMRPRKRLRRWLMPGRKRRRKRDWTLTREEPGYGRCPAARTILGCEVTTQKAGHEAAIRVAGFDVVERAMLDERVRKIGGQVREWAVHLP